MALEGDRQIQRHRKMFTSIINCTFILYIATSPHLQCSRSCWVKCWLPFFKSFWFQHVLSSSFYDISNCAVTFIAYNQVLQEEPFDKENIRERDVSLIFQLSIQFLALSICCMCGPRLVKVYIVLPVFNTYLQVIQSITRHRRVTEILRCGLQALCRIYRIAST